MAQRGSITKIGTIEDGVVTGWHFEDADVGFDMDTGKIAGWTVQELMVVALVRDTFGDFEAESFVDWVRV